MNSLSTQDTIQNALSNTMDAVVNTVYPTQTTTTTNSTPTAPHGIPPSEECHQGKVAYEDKTLTGKLSENLENLQSGISSSLRGRPSIEALIDLQNEGLPRPPHGQAPSDSNHLGVVSDQDKTYLTRISENLPSIPSIPTLPLPSLPLPAWSEYRQEISAFYDSFPQSLTDSVNQAKRTIGLSTTGAPVSIPNPPRGVPPSDNGSGMVSNLDKPIQLQLEENWDTLRSEFMNLWTQSKRKLGWNWIQPGQVPVSPRGIPPTQDNPTGVVDDRDKTLAANIDETVCKFRDAANQKVDEGVKYVQESGLYLNAVVDDLVSQGNRLYVGVAPRTQAQGSNLPEPPHGVPPSEGLSTGIIAEEDKTVQQKLTDAWEQAKEAASEKMNNNNNATDSNSILRSENSAPLTGGYL